MTSLKPFSDVWRDIQENLKPGLRIQTLCQGILNEIIEVNPDNIKVASSRSKTQKVRLITSEDFEYVWKILMTEGVFTLQGLNKIIGRRAITCAILARLPYLEGRCDRGRVSLSVKRKLE